MATCAWIVKFLQPKHLYLHNGNPPGWGTGGFVDVDINEWCTSDRSITELV